MSINPAITHYLVVRYGVVSPVPNSYHTIEEGPPESPTIRPMIRIAQRAVFCILLSTIAIPSVGQDVKRSQPFLQTSICELAAYPDRFDGKNVMIHAYYFVNWEWGAGFQGQGCKGVPLRYSSPANPYIPSQYSRLKVNDDVEYREFAKKESLLCNGMGMGCDYDSIEADFAGVFVSWKHLKSLAPSRESVLIVTQVSHPKLRDIEAAQLELTPVEVPDRIPESHHDPR